LDLATYKKQLLDYLADEIKVVEPLNLYEPIKYILEIGGKRLRPVLCLQSCDLFGSDYKKALSASLAIEIFHNFTLLHDDIMDAADIRRGKKTVHKKWNENTGILSGDAMLILAYKYLENYDSDIYKELMLNFNKTALEVCEGQQYDIDFETRTDVTLPEYFKMITFKTAVLLACSLKIGAIIAKASDMDKEAIYNFGLHLGIAFQLQDDFLDTFGNQKTFGKRIGGDIIENKKTFLYLKLLEVISESDKKILDKWFSTEQDSESKIKEIIALYVKYDIPNVVKNEIQKYSDLAISDLHKTSLSNDAKMAFEQLGKSLNLRSV